MCNLQTYKQTNKIKTNHIFQKKDPQSQNTLNRRQLFRQTQQVMVYLHTAETSAVIIQLM